MIARQRSEFWSRGLSSTDPRLVRGLEQVADPSIRSGSQDDTAFLQRAPNSFSPVSARWTLRRPGMRIGWRVRPRVGDGPPRGLRSSGGLGLAQVEPDALVVGALGADAVAFVLGLARGASRGAHPLDGGLDIVDAEHRDHRRSLRTAAETGHRRDIRHVPGVRLAALLEAHAQD